MVVEEEERWWLWKPPEGAKYVGKRGVPRKDAKEKASGKTVYCRDIYLPGMVYAKHLDSPYANAKIKSMDTSKAEKIPGVIAVIRWDDPEFKGKWPKWSPYEFTMPVFLPWIMDRAYFYGQPVGAIVVAESEEACDEALKILKENTEWEELPFNLNWDEYENHPPAWPEYEKYSPLVRGKHEFVEGVGQLGDVEKGFQEANRIIEFTIRKSEEDVWAGVEAGVAVARWQGDKLEIWSNYYDHLQIKPRLAREEVAPESNTEVYVLYRGGGFGGLAWTHQAVIEPLVAMLAKRLGRPVKYLDDYSNFRGAEHHLGTYKFKVGFKNNGIITAVRVDTVYACRGFNRMGGLSDPVNKLVESTCIPNIALHSVYPLVNRNPTICYKHGAPSCTVVTMAINRVAAELGMDPTEVALKNDGCHGHTMKWIMENIAGKQGFNTSRWSLKECIEVGKKAIGWDEKWHPPGTKKLLNGKYHGIGFTAMEQWSHVPAFSLRVTSLPINVSVGIKVNSDGTVSILGLRNDAGVASDTTYCQVVADEMGMRYEDVNHMFSIDKGYTLQRMSGSFSMIANLVPIIIAARKAKNMLLKYATQLLDNFKGKKPNELDIKDSIVFEKANPTNAKPIAEIAKICYMRGGNIIASSDTFDFHLKLPRELPCMVRQAAFVEVEVDPETGKVDVTNLVFVNDVGRVINPDVVDGQRYPYMGLGRALTEAIHYDPLTGVKLNDNLATYDIMLMNDVKNINLHTIETGLGYGPYGATGCSEVGGAVLSTIAAPAIYNAIGKWIDDWPITPDKVLKALGKT